jgi:hypothetical protein
MADDRDDEPDYEPDYDFELERRSLRHEDYEYDAMMDAAHEAFMGQVEETIHEQAQGSARAYLGTYGDAASARIDACLSSARALSDSGEHGPAVTSACTAIELTINYLLLRPLVQGAFLSDVWAGILTDAVLNSRSGYQQLLPAVAKGWDLDLDAVRLASGAIAWGAFTGEIWPLRRKVVHPGAPATEDQARRAIECAEVLLSGLVEPVAKRLGLTWPDEPWHGRPGDIFGVASHRFEPADPLD